MTAECSPAAGAAATAAAAVLVREVRERREEWLGERGEGNGTETANIAGYAILALIGCMYSHGSMNHNYKSKYGNDYLNRPSP